MSDVSGNGDTGLGARVLGEALRTPAFREIFKLHLSEVGRGEGRDLVKTLLQQDPELGFSLASAGPRALEGAAESLAELGQVLSSMPPSLVDAYLTALLRELDTAALQTLLNQYHCQTIAIQ